ncbi:GTPase ObgE [Rickettsiales bacterium]|nr:GTPase ObgE [Rickettsiales bacterium]
MQFIDEAKIFVKSGHGGNGCMSFRREANLPKGGPDGGNGGRGGSIIARCVHGLNTLIDYRYSQHFKAKRGTNGSGGNRHGAGAAHLILDMPVGTQIFREDTGQLLVDFTEEGQEIVIAKGGEGGLGNANFKSSTNQAPRKTTPGKPGEDFAVILQLKLLSDVGLVGMPNAGKSTFLSIVSRARPKIADYPFTTLKPQLGVVYIDEKEFVVADIPGLIEGAHEGVGLGIRFLKHVERCGVILHLVDGTGEDPIGAYNIIRNELEKYSQELFNKQEIIALNKIDAMAEEDIKEIHSELEKISKKKVFLLSTVTGKGRDEVLRPLLSEVEKFRSKRK